MGRVISITDTPSTPSRKTQLDDVTSAFYFSRLPREERIAKTLLYVLASRNAARKPEASAEPVDLKAVELIGVIDLLSVSEELAQYSVKDFAVRPGRL